MVESGRTINHGRLETTEDTMSLIQNVNDVERDDSNFVVHSTEQFNLADKHALTTLCINRSLDVMKQVIEQIEFPQDTLAHAASEPAVFCSPTKMAYLLTKIHDSGDLRRVIQNGIKGLSKHNQACEIPGVLRFFGGQVLLGVNLHDTAMQTAFLEGAQRQVSWLIDDCQGHPAIDSVMYGDALVCAGRGDLQHPSFQGLIERADKRDLEMALSRIEGSQSVKFRAAIEGALTKADVGGTRLNFSIMTAWMTRRILDKDLNVRMPIVIINMIITYITDEQLAARRSIVEEGGIMTQSARLSNLLRELMDDGYYDMVYKMARRMGKEIFKHHLYSSMTTVEHYKGVHGYLSDNFLLEDFLIKGTRAGVTAVIQEIDEDDKLHLHTNPISRALNTAFKDGNFDRVVCLLLALKGRCELGNATEVSKISSELSTVMQYMFDYAKSMKDIRAHAKHFLVLHGDEFDDNHFAIHQMFCKELGRKVRREFGDSCPREFLIDLARQPVPVSVRALVEGLVEGHDLDKMPYYIVGLAWREFHQSLIFENQDAGWRLWPFMKRSIPSKYVGEFPSSAKACQAFLNRFKPRRELQMEGLLRELNAILKGSGDDIGTFPMVLLSLIAEYIIR